MIEADKRKMLFMLYEAGISISEMSIRLHCSRNTIRRIIKEKGKIPKSIRKDKIILDEEILRQLYNECNGYIQRVHEKLVEEKNINVTYSTLTRILRELEISTPKKVRCEREPDLPGGEMQHDTSEYNVKLADIKVKLIGSVLYLRYSKKRYLKFYRRFNRFIMKCFLHEALMNWKYAAKDCIIDNTNLARHSGLGKNAIMVPEMREFGLRYGFEFHCHEIGHANRKAGEERSFYTVTTNFLAGRTFESFEDLNRQAFEWSTVRMEYRPQGKARIIPAKAFEYEQQYLIKLLPHMPPPYQEHQRITDQYGYISFNGNYYWIPGTKRDEVTVLEYEDNIKIYLARECIAEYKIPGYGIKNILICPEGQTKPKYRPRHQQKPTQIEEQRLRATCEIVNAYLDFALKLLNGIPRHQFIRRLFALSQKMTQELFLKSIERAYKYQVTDINTIERISIIYLSQDLDIISYPFVDDSFKERNIYQEGCLTELPDLEAYDKILEKENE